MLSKFAGAEINLEDAKAESPRLMIMSRHEGNPIERECITAPKSTKARGENLLSLVASVLYAGTQMPTKGDPPSIANTWKRRLCSAHELAAIYLTRFQGHARAKGHGCSLARRIGRAVGQGQMVRCFLEG